MLVFSVGPDELNKWDLQEVNKFQDDYVWLVYWYEGGGYEGSGEAVALYKDGLLHCKNLGHCSCYGPMEGWGSENVMTIEKFLEPKDDIHVFDCMEAVKEKVKSLV